MTPKMRWFWVKLTKKIGSREHAWVRGDVVTFKPFTKNKSSFDGGFVEKYDKDTLHELALFLRDEGIQLTREHTDFYQLNHWL
jgi:hypothetical protein